MRNQTTGGRKRLVAATVIAITLAATGCHVNQPEPPTPSTGATKALDELKSLPSLEDTQTQVQNAMDEITSAARTAIPAIHWQTLDEGSHDQCEQPYDRTYGQRYFLPDQVAADVAVSEENWAKILQVAKDAAARIGATDIQVMQDQPGNHDVWFSGATGMFIKIGYRGNLVVSGYTGCRLPGGG